MLALSSTIHNPYLKYFADIAPEIQSAFDLTDDPTNMSDKEDFLFSRTQPSSLSRQSAESPSQFGLQSNRFTPWSTSTYDPFAGEPAGRMTPDHPEPLRQRLPPEIHSAPRPPASTAVGESLRPLSFTSQSSAFTSEAGSYQPLGPPPRSDPDDHTMALRRQSQDSYGLQTGSPSSQGYADYELETQNRRGSEMGRAAARYHTRRRPFNQDEFDGPSQLLPLPLPQQEHARSQALPALPVHLAIEEQDEIMLHVNDILSRCAFHFVAKYQFPIPLERDKPRVRAPEDREWTEWAYLLKRLATKRRIPARVLYDNQIKQFVTTLENSIAVRQPNREQQVRRPRDDRYMLQLISAGTQVAKIMMDSLSMEQLDALYRQTESLILERRSRLRGLGLQ
ncbi:hypothetical protein ABEF95_003050 [Exophiala dermatitidis]